jgi:hypothetical protein
METLGVKSFTRRTYATVPNIISATTFRPIDSFNHRLPMLGHILKVLRVNFVSWSVPAFLITMTRHFTAVRHKHRSSFKARANRGTNAGDEISERASEANSCAEAALATTAATAAGAALSGHQFRLVLVSFKNFFRHIALISFVHIFAAELIASARD